MQLGGNLDEPVTGRFSDRSNINNKPSCPADLYFMDEALNMMRRKVIDDYP